MVFYEEDAFIYSCVAAIVVCLIVVVCFGIATQQGAFVPASYEDKVNWCFEEVPIENVTPWKGNDLMGDNTNRAELEGRIVTEVCYGDAWEDFCKVIRPKACPTTQVVMGEEK